MWRGCEERWRGSVELSGSVVRVRRKVERKCRLEWECGEGEKKGGEGE